MCWLAQFGHNFQEELIIRNLLYAQKSLHWLQQSPSWLQQQNESYFQCLTVLTASVHMEIVFNMRQQPKLPSSICSLIIWIQGNEWYKPKNHLEYLVHYKTPSPKVSKQTSPLRRNIKSDANRMCVVLFEKWSHKKFTYLIYSSTKRTSQEIIPGYDLQQ